MDISSQQRAEAYAIFCRLWALASLFHLGSYNEWVASIYHLLLACAALSLFFHPTSLYRLLSLCLLQLLQLAVQAPMVSNHWLFTGFVNATILHTFVYQAYKQKRFAVDRAIFFETFASLLRIELLILYFFVVLHKLNADFFALDTSCAIRFYLAQAERYSILPRSLSWAQSPIYFTLLIEILIPLLLCVRRTRHGGILLGLVFHGVISFNPVSKFYNFSSMLFALFFLFTSKNVLTSGREFLSAWRCKLTQTSFAAKLLWGAVLAATVLLVLHYLDQNLKKSGDLYLVVWSLYGLLALGTFALLLIKPRRFSDIGPILVPRHTHLLILPGLLLLNGMSPYLGLKTETSFAMYSNLRTEGGITNHFFLPAKMQIFPYQNDLVQIQSASSNTIKSLTVKDQMIPFFELRRAVSQRPHTAISYWRNGVSTTVRDAANVSELSQPVPLLLRKLLYFRPINKTGPQECTH